jgi:hypothetical protein
MATPGPKSVSVDQARALVQATTFDIFNEHDQSKRRQLMKKYWAADVSCYSPFGVAIGYDALDQVWGGGPISSSVARIINPTLFANHMVHLFVYDLILRIL